MPVGTADRAGGLRGQGTRARLIARAYFAGQAVAGALWWVGVFAAVPIRQATLGAWNPWLLVIPDLVLFVGCSAWAAIRGSGVAALIAAGWTVALTVVLGGYALISTEAGWGVVLMTCASVGSVGAAFALRSGRLPIGWFFSGPFRFRPARPGSPGHHLAVSLTQLVIFWTGFFVLLPLALSWLERRLQLRSPALAEAPWPVIGLALFLLASPLGLAACVTMALRGQGTPLPAQTARELVVSGPYRWIRNPMAAAGVLQSIGMGLWFGTWTMIVCAVAGAVFWHLLIRPAEEADLLARLGPPYHHYRGTVPLWVPLRKHPI